MVHFLASHEKYRDRIYEDDDRALARPAAIRWASIVSAGRSEGTLGSTRATHFFLFPFCAAPLVLW
jgi:hypothetical protein